MYSFPNFNMQDLNLDWILQQIKNMASAIEEQTTNLENSLATQEQNNQEALNLSQYQSQVVASLLGYFPEDSYSIVWEDGRIVSITFLRDLGDDVGNYCAAWLTDNASAISTARTNAEAAVTAAENATEIAESAVDVFENMVADEYDSTKVYNPGDYAIVEVPDPPDGVTHILYRCIAQTTGSFEIDDWVQVALANDISDLKHAFNEITSGTSNLFDIRKLKANGINIDTEGASATGTGLAFESNFVNGIPLNIEFKANTQYTLKAIAKHAGESATGNGLRLRFKYTDDTYSLMVFSNTNITDTEQTMTSTQGKTIANISMNCGSATSNVWTVKQIQLNEGTSVKEYMPYRTAEDLIARKDIEPLQKSANNKKITFSVIGDSYSAYPAWIPEGNASYYPTASETVKNVTQMWWYILSKSINANPITIDGWSGAKITTTEGSDSNSAFVKRIENSMGENKSTEIKPDIIFILGGQNDTNAQVTIGQPKYSDWTDEDLTTFAPAFCYMLDYLRLWNPSTRIINLVNVGGISQDMQDMMASICSHYNVENVLLSGIQKASHHPTATGMQTIADIIAENIK